MKTRLLKPGFHSSLERNNRGHWKSSRDSANSLPHGLHGGERVALGSNEDVSRSLNVLRERNEDLRNRIALDCLPAHISDHTDDGGVVVLVGRVGHSATQHSLAERALIAEVAPCQPLIKDDDAALAHAIWNAMIKSSRDVLLDMTTVTLAGGIVAAPLLLVAPQPARESWPYLAASCVLHIGYYVAVVGAYRAGDLSHGYPIMRGVAPLLVSVCALVWLGEAPTPAVWAGVLLICGGVLEAC